MLGGDKRSAVETSSCGGAAGGGGSCPGVGGAAGEGCKSLSSESTVPGSALGPVSVLGHGASGVVLELPGVAPGSMGGAVKVPRNDREVRQRFLHSSREALRTAAMSLSKLDKVEFNKLLASEPLTNIQWEALIYLLLAALGFPSAEGTIIMMSGKDIMDLVAPFLPEYRGGTVDVKLDAAKMHPVLLMRRAANGSLQDWIKTQNPSREAVLRYLVRLAEIFRDLTLAGVVVCDIKPQNLGVDEHGLPMLIDPESWAMGQPGDKLAEEDFHVSAGYVAEAIRSPRYCVQVMGNYPFFIMVLLSSLTMLRHPEADGWWGKEAPKLQNWGVVQVNCPLLFPSSRGLEDILAYDTYVAACADKTATTESTGLDKAALEILAKLLFCTRGLLARRIFTVLGDPSGVLPAKVGDILVRLVRSLQTDSGATHHEERLADLGFINDIFVAFFAVVEADSTTASWAEGKKPKEETAAAIARARAATSKIGLVHVPTCGWVDEPGAAGASDATD